jgi:metallo-beta-lactamase class B
MRLGRSLAIAAAALLASCTPTQRIGAYSAFMNDDRPAEPFAIAPDLFYVGSSDIAVFALRTDEGLVLIDGGYGATGRAVPAKLRQLGLDVRDVRLLLNTHAHFDHAAGLAFLQETTGAPLHVSEAEAELMESGGRTDFSRIIRRRSFEPVAVTPFAPPGGEAPRHLRDGDVVRLGQYALTAHLTPGHTKGCTSWSFDIDMDARADVEDLRRAVIFCSLNLLPFYRLDGASYREMPRDFAATFASLEGLRCDVLLVNHGRLFDLARKRDALLANAARAARNPFDDPSDCRRYVETQERRFTRRLRGRSPDDLQAFPRE